MDRKPTPIFCHGCHSYTRSIEPILMTRFGECKLRIECVCQQCLKGKAKQYSYGLPLEIYDMPIGTLYINYIIENNNKKRIFDIVDGLLNHNL